MKETFVVSEMMDLGIGDRFYFGMLDNGKSDVDKVICADFVERYFRIVATRLDRTKIKISVSGEKIMGWLEVRIDNSAYVVKRKRKWIFFSAETETWIPMVSPQRNWLNKHGFRERIWVNVERI